MKGKVTKRWREEVGKGREYEKENNCYIHVPIPQKKCSNILQTCTSKIKTEKKRIIISMKRKESPLIFGGKTKIII